MTQATGASISSLIQHHASRNAELLEGLASTDYAVKALEEQKRLLSDLRLQADRSDSKVRQLVISKQVELSQHEQWRDSHVKRFAYKATGQKDKFNERAKKEEQEYFQVLQDLHQEQQIHQYLVQHIKEAEEVQRELEAKMFQRGQLQTELDNMYNFIFSGATPELPDEDRKEEMSNQALQDYYDTSSRAEAESTVLRFLNEAHKKMSLSTRHMNTALYHSRVDMFGGGSVNDYMERNALLAADKLIKEAEMDVYRAQQASPLIGDMPRIDINHGSLMSDVLFDNIFSDMAFHEEISRGRVEVDRTVNWLERQLQQSKRRSDGLQEERKHRASSLENARVALQRARQDAFERVAAGKSAGSGEVGAGVGAGAGTGPGWMPPLSSSSAGAGNVFSDMGTESHDEQLPPYSPS